MNLQEISSKLSDRGVIKSRWAFAFFVKFLNKTREIKYGDYIFNEPVSVFGIISRMVRGEFGVKLVKIRVPEGSDNRDIAEIFSGFENFNKAEFLDKAKNHEGYLFPDTYLIPSTAETDEIIEAMRDNFNAKIGKVDHEIVTMASLIEKESSQGKERKIISGILWKRLKIGMPLQVDAVFPYLTRREKIFLADLKINSPYNTYLHKGLPPGPIANPGPNAIDAALHPQKSPYLYYLHDKSGRIHFAKTYKEHFKNKEKYLK
ncbi:MAG: endolytic transglycosylase MltG [Candidatus Brocadia sp.]|nr:endolytic transglycosylase MltG [Candidatus Brocadia sp.]